MTVSSESAGVKIVRQLLRRISGKEKYNLRALAVCYDFLFLYDLARNNIKNVYITLNLDVMTSPSSPSYAIACRLAL
jgi:hypothetical protein